MKDIVFYLGMAMLFTHELDAMPNHEWRQLAILSSLADETAMMVFVALHVPLFAVLIALVASSNPRVRTLSRIVIGAFLIVHGLLHASSIGDPGYEFSSRLSNVLIFGGSAFGVGYLVLETKARFA